MPIRASVVNRLRRDESGFGLLELLMAMIILNFGILALVAAFNSGAVALKRANEVATASVLADKQMELYRAMLYDSIGLDPVTVTAADADLTYRNDLGRGYPTRVMSSATCAADPFPNPCTAKQAPVTGPDGRGYRVDTYIWEEAPTGTARPLKIITVVVRSSDNPPRTLVREQSTFDKSTGLPAS